MRLRAYSALIAVLFAGIASLATDHLVVGDFSSGGDAHGVPVGWQLKEKSGRASFSIVNVEGRHAVQLRSTNTSFCLQRPVKADLAHYPILSWQWKVTRLPEGGDFRKTKTDDQAAQLFVAFNATQAIVYLWDTSAPEGLMTSAPSPPFMSIKAVVVRSKPVRLGQWITETRNVYEDYKKLYGANAKPPVVSGIRIQINTQHTGTAAESYFANLTFKADAKNSGDRRASASVSGLGKD
jgi:hypothetical protein